MLFAGGFLMAGLLFQWGSSLPKTCLHLPVSESVKVKNILAKKPNPRSFKPLSPQIDNFYYHSLLPLKEQTYQNTECYNVYLGENTGIQEALGWLKYHFPAKTFEKDFSYAL
ncbi:hypothetical protein CPX_001819, partial [Candidatus Phytoplasma pruni]